MQETLVHTRCANTVTNYQKPTLRAPFQHIIFLYYFFCSIDSWSHGLTVPRSGKKIVCEEMAAIRTTYHDGKHNLQMKVP